MGTPVPAKKGSFFKKNSKSVYTYGVPYWYTTRYLTYMRIIRLTHVLSVYTRPIHKNIYYHIYYYIYLSI